MTTNQIKKIETTLDFLYEALSWTNLYYFTVKTLFQAIHDGYNLFHNSFFFTSYQAILNETLIGLSKIIVEHPDSISFDYLLNLVELSCKHFPHASKEEIQKSVTSHRHKIQSYQVLINKIKSQRDLNLAHSDRKLITQPDLIAAEPFIVLDEIEDLIEDLLTILNTYSIYLKQSEYDLSHMKGKAQQDVAYLVSIYNETLTGM